MKKIFGAVVKRRARKLVIELIAAAEENQGHTAAQERRSDAARSLIKIIKIERGGEEIVARKFIKRPSKGVRALLKLSDDELEQYGYSAVSPVSESIAFTELLRVVIKYTRKSRFFKTTISTALREGEEGVAAILYLAMVEPKAFFRHIEHQLILTFCKRILTKEDSISPKWYCNAKLLCILFMNNVHPRRGAVSPLIRQILPSILKQMIKGTNFNPSVDSTGKSQTDPVSDRQRLLPLIALCCEEIQSRGYWFAVPQTDILDPFIEALIDFIQPADTVLRRLDSERGFAVWTLMSLFKRQFITQFLPRGKLSQIATIFMDMALYPWAPESRGDIFEKSILKPLDSSLDIWCISSLCDFPGPTFNGALALALSRGLLQLRSPNTANPYEPLALVERLLWLSNIKPSTHQQKQIHVALVEGGACSFLAQVLSHTGHLAPDDRGLWRAKGLAITCFGNIVELMDPTQLLARVSKEMIDAVVAIKEREDVPLVQKGQAIFTLQRYTLTANRWRIEPHYREDISSMVDDSWMRGDPDDPAEIMI